MFEERQEFFKDRPTGIDSETNSSESAVRVLLKRFPSIGTMPELKAAHKAQTSSNRVTLSWFSDEFQSFPVKMAYKKVPWVRDMWDGLYNRFKKTDLYFSWKEEESNWKTADDYMTRPLAVVFLWPKWKLCCMHNCESKKFGGSWYSITASSKSKDSLKIVRTLDNGESFVIEPFDQFLESINWSK